MNRRRFLAGVAAVPLAAQQSRPNILFCIADDQSWLHASAYGSRFVRTPAFDRVAREGVLFRHGFVSTPSCGPSRAAALTGQDFYRLREASMNHTEWRRGLVGYPDLLADAGYSIGFTGKGWAPGNWKIAGRKYSPCGPEYNAIKNTPPADGISDLDYSANFDAFLKQRKPGSPFCFWAGFSEPHRILPQGIGVKNGKKLTDVEVPPFLPDSPEVRGDLADYAYEIEWYDRHLGVMLNTLEKAGQLHNTIVVVTADNGMAFPRAKGNLYDYGARVPLAIRWGARAKGGRVSDTFVSFVDFAPTFLEAAGLRRPEDMTGKSLMPHLTGQSSRHREFAVFGIERHFPGSRPNGAGYPSRAIRTRDYLYIRNLTPDRNPVGDRPGPVWPSDDPVGGFGDTDGGPSKTYLWEQRAKYGELVRLAFDKRPAEELYALDGDPANMKNVEADPRHAGAKSALVKQLDEYLKQTDDPRIIGNGDVIDAVMRRYPSLSPEVNRQQEGRK